jgi:predicted dehydrogenase
MGLGSGKGQRETMSSNETDLAEFNRRNFIKGSSAATIMTMLGGVPLFAQTNQPAAGETDLPVAKMKVAVIGLGVWGREILNTLARVKQADVAGVCDTFPASLKRGAGLAPKAIQTNDYKTLLENKDIKAVIIATPTHKHKEIALAALKVGKHVYCEAPLAHSIEDARAIAMAAKAANQQVFQTGLQLRADPERNFLVPFIRSGAMGDVVMARSQWNKKTSWWVTASSSEREKELNWRLDKDVSLGLMGEIGMHQLDQANWFLNARPKSITGFGSVLAYTQDGRQIPDTVQAIVQYPRGVNLTYNATLANSFDSSYDMFYGTFAAIMLRPDHKTGDDKAWLFKEADSTLLGWEIYAKKDTFYEETGIQLVAGASKSVQTKKVLAPGEVPVNTALSTSLKNFLMNADDLDNAISQFVDIYGKDADPKDLGKELAKLVRRSAAGYLEGYQAAVTAIKAHEAVMGSKKVEIAKELYELA